MNNSTNLQAQVEQESQERLEREWREWQQAHAEKRRVLGYDKPVSDDEALEILGLL